MIRARDPRVSFPLALRHRLAPRPVSPEYQRFLLIQCMPPHNGLEPVIAAVRNELARRFPQATIETMMRRDFMIDDAVERAEVAAMADTAILFVGPAATSAHVTWKYGSAL